LGWFAVNGFGFHVYNNGQCWQYDAGTDKWQQMANLNVPGTLYNASSFAVGGSGYILGDLNLQAYNFNESMKLFRYDFASNEWSQCAKNNYPGDGAYQISAISFNGIAYVGLGYNNGDFNATDFWKFQ
jgi:catechol-2,3-dioxygenase